MTQNIIKPPNLHHCDRQDILTYFLKAWQIEDSLMHSLINPESFYTNPDPLRNLLVFYLGHSAAFYINKLVSVGLVKQRVNDYFEILFEIGVDPERPDDIASAFAHLREAKVEEVWQYRQDVHDVICELINSVAIALPIDPEHPLWALMMAIEHQYIHVETSSMLIRQLPTTHLHLPDDWHYAPTTAQNGDLTNKLQLVAGGQIKLGKPKNSSIYGWDIEYGDRLVSVANFYASQYLVTNAEFGEFVSAGGYANPDYWQGAAAEWQQQQQVTHPKFWIPDPSVPTGYRYRTVFEEIEMPLHYPAEVNYYEAIAYCRWKGKEYRLMTEAEWHLATYGNAPESALCSQNSTANLELQFASPSCVGTMAASPSGLYDLRGNVWEWLSDHLTPLTGYQSHPLYSNYSSPYFDDKHQMMAGGSWITCGTEAERYYRNWFRPNFYQHAGFRYATSEN